MAALAAAGTAENEAYGYRLTFALTAEEIAGRLQAKVQLAPTPARP